MNKRQTLPLLILLSILTVFSLTSVSAQGTPVFRVYLAFEDGPTDAYTPGILDILAQYNAHAAFVIAGAQVAGHEDLLQREIREGHTLINHLWEEPSVYAGAPAEAVIESYQRTEQAIQDALGDMLSVYETQPKMFWQPGGAARPFPATDGIQVITYNWNINSDDCGWAMPDNVDLDTLEFDQAVIQNILGRPVSVGSFHNPYNTYDYGDGAIIIFHDLNRVTGRVLPTILSELQRAGASFEALPRPWDGPGTMPVVLGAAPHTGSGFEGYSIPVELREAAHLREIPDLNGSILTTLPAGEPLTAVGRTSNWIQVVHADRTAWIARDLLDMYGAIPNLPLRVH
jgi:peptidoglycan/xylan/chitin deacetylase (PgdA/CDA1 family)